MLKQIINLILLLLVTACQPGVVTVRAQPDLIARDVNIYTDVADVDLLQYEELIDDLYLQVERMGYSTKILKKKAKLLDIYVKAEPVDCPGLSDDGKCSGLSQWMTNWIEYHHNDTCLGRTALPHELVHWSKGWLHRKQSDPSDGNHNDPAWFSEAGSLEVILMFNGIIRCANDP